MTFLHGVETLEQKIGPRIVRTPRTAVLGLVGSAPKGPVNQLVAVRNPQDAAQFGDPLPGFSIPQALADIFKQGGATVLVVNVVDTTQNTNTLAVTAETFEIENRAGKLAYAPFGTLLITSDGGGDETPETRATATFTATSGALTGDTYVFGITDGPTFVSGTVGVDKTANQLASDLNSAINGGTSTHGYSSTVSGAVLTVTAPVGSGATVNGDTFSFTNTGSITHTKTAFSGGVTAVGPDIEYTEGTDYTVDAFGNVTILAPVGTIAEGATLKATYRRYNDASVNSSQIIGTISGSTKTGFKLFDNAKALFGFKARFYLAPEYSDINAVAQEMIAVANKHRGRALIDAPAGTSLASAIAGRGPSGNINFRTSDKRALLCFPRTKVEDQLDGATTRPFSQFLAGVIAATHQNDGYWFSPSNREIVGIVGTEIPITHDWSDANCDANALNEAGIITIANTEGGLRTWGNRSAAFPTSTFPDNFISVGTVQDVVHDALEAAMIPFIDKPITQATIDAIRETVNGFFRTLIQRGAIVDGVCTFDPAKNPPEEIGAGHLTFDLTFMPPTPAERITFLSYLDISLLKTLQ